MAILKRGKGRERASKREKTCFIMGKCSLSLPFEGARKICWPWSELRGQAPGCISKLELTRWRVICLMPWHQICVIMEFIILLASISGSPQRVVQACSKGDCQMVFALVPPTGTYHIMAPSSPHYFILATMFERFWRNTAQTKISS